MHALAQKALQQEDHGSVQNLLEMILQVGIAKTGRVHPRNIIIDMNNRDEMGLILSRMQNLITETTTSKWHDHLFDGMVTDIPSNEIDAVLDFNRTIVAGSKNRVAPVIAAQAQYTTLRGNHNTAGHRAVLAGCAHPDETLTTNGLLDLGKVIAKCPSLEPVLMSGAFFTIIPSWFLQKYPGLKDIIIGTGNVLSNVAEADGDVQVMSKMQVAIASKTPYQKMYGRLESHRFKNLGSAQFMYQFMAKFQGAKAKELMHYLRSTVNGAVHLPSDLWEVTIQL